VCKVIVETRVDQQIQLYKSLASSQSLEAQDLEATL